MDISTILLLSFIVFFAHFIGALTGFGATVLALPFTISLIGIETGKPLLIVAVFLQTLLVAIEKRAYIDFKEVKRILPLVAIGTPIGIVLFNILPQELLITMLSIFMMLIAIKGLLELKGHTFKTPSDFVLNILLFIGGIMNGAFVSGGPLVMIYASEKIKDKDTFRGTMSMVWVLLNAYLLADAFLRGQYTTEVVAYTAVSLPSLFIGIFLASKLSDKINQTKFKSITYNVLGITAIFTFF